MSEINECTHGYAAHERRHCVHCTYADEIANRDAENKRLKAEILFVYQAAKNDVNRWDGGMCIGTQRFSDRLFARRLVRDLEPLIITEVSVSAESTETTEN